MTDLPEKLAGTISNFETVDDPDFRSTMLIDYADRFQEVPERISTRPFPKDRQVPFCESEAYVWLEPLPDKKVKLHFAVENPSGISAKALAAVLDQTLSGLPPEEIAKVSPEIVYKLFGRNISMGKGQGLTALVTMVKTEAQKLASGSPEA
ncbi:SufE family protein [candidate division KSB1 bacterium]|nr:SufE family protein [candidate division KSB1 bacterium]NIR69932.1 SufE family protein [candidate division KSB1 bacterium]NIS25841.1 SufE family protein [candidate division KSB1 bacterium]NIT72716.1 SufE family protein [candidate division KSB1 bacterium]NIU26530.1 SufE family protein [candidate division KSB1 bacterium]